ncbi:hypothetical protein D6833_12965 [Candidatus Parcubacteria bacterium]|nr:MAG: hypothetical protein D6833_12965 [Candidatus Parcubacteria bacterium]
MSITITISEEVAQHLNSLSFDAADDINQKLRKLLEAEYRRRLARYHLTNRHLSQKYQMSFEEFERERLTEKLDYCWEVESDAIAWETAVDGIRTVQRQLTQLTLEGQGDDH